MTKFPSRPLTAEIVSIGDEMTSGARLDTNAQWLSRRLGELGIEVKFHSTVGDTLADNVDVFRIAAARADVIVATGGLGPTRDDLTREALASATGRPLVMFDSAMQHIESMFKSRDRVMPERNRVQAMFPEGSLQIFNPQGTAPGVDVLFESGGRAFALPGVPAEMKQMFDATVTPRILEIASDRGTAGGTFIRHHVMKFFGTGESDMEERLGEMIHRQRSPRVGITVSAATISLRITATGESEAACAEQITQTRAEISNRVSEFYFGDGEGFEQQHAIDLKLRSLGQSLVVVELGRAAPLGDWFSGLRDTQTYRGGLSLSNASDLMKLFDAASVNDALQAIASRYEAEWVLAIDAYPLLNANADTPLPPSEIRFMLKDPQGEFHEQTAFIGGHPSIVQPRIAKAAMKLMRQKLSMECGDG